MKREDAGHLPFFVALCLVRIPNVGVLSEVVFNTPLHNPSYNFFNSNTLSMQLGISSRRCVT